MKLLPLLLTLFAVSCASKTPPAVNVGPSPGRDLNRTESAAVRYPEKIKAYPLGRYTDPNHRGLMHEAHTVYRVETTPKWNLSRRGRSSPPDLSASNRGELSRNELMVELTRQREATKAVMQSGDAVSTKLTDLANSLQKNQQALAEQNAGIRKELKATRERLETLERKADQQPAFEATPPSDDAPW